MRENSIQILYNSQNSIQFTKWSSSMITVNILVNIYNVHHDINSLLKSILNHSFSQYVPLLCFNLKKYYWCDIVTHSIVFPKLHCDRDSFMTLLSETKEKYYSLPK